MKYPVIEGREIVPVRLIPLIANAWLGYEAIAGILANRVGINAWPYPSDQELIEVNVIDEATGCAELTSITRAKLIGPQQRDNGVHAYHLNNDGNPVKMWSSEWDSIYREISLAELKQRKKEKKNGVPGSRESTWKLRVTKILPSGVFLWRDELDLLWNAHISTFSKRIKYHPDFLKMNHDVYLSPVYFKLVWEGFEHLMPPEKLLYTSAPSLPPIVVSIAMTQSNTTQLEPTDQSTEKRETDTDWKQEDGLLFRPQGITNQNEAEIDIPIVEFAAKAETNSAESNSPFNVDDHITSHRKTTDCKRTNCSSCKKHDCRNKLAYELFVNYGERTEHRIHLWKIGVALGLPEPTWAIDRDNETQMGHQRDQVSAIKATVSRWKKAHKKIVTSPHPAVTS